MKIVSINVRKEDLSLNRPYKIAFKHFDSVQNGIIEIIAGNGMRGYGAFNPSYEVIGEKLDDALDVLTSENLEWLIGREATDIDLLCSAVQKKFVRSVTARTGLEIALYDLFCQKIKMPLSTYLGQKVMSMPTSITIGIKNVYETIEEAREYIQRGFKILKVKLGESVEADLERVIKVREVFGDKVGIVVDVNEGYDRHQTITFYERARQLNILLIEQPLKRGEEEIMAGLPEEIKRVIAADESLITLDDALALATTPRACGYFNVKLMKCGGITEARKIAGVADGAGIGLMWGCNDESVISITAALHVAFACNNTRFIDLDGSFDLSRDVAAGGFRLKDGMLSILDKPGLGLTPL